MRQDTDNIDLDFDFGFSAMHETELESVQSAETIQKKLDTLYAAIGPLLENLKKTPEKDYIFWPNRTEKIREFEEKLKKIYDS